MPAKPRLCAAPDQPAHPATHRTGYCDVHHTEYQKARSAHNSRVSKATKTASTPAAPSDDDAQEIDADWLTRVRFTPLADAWTLLSPDQRHQIRQASLRLGTSAARLAPTVATTDDFFNVDADDIIRLALDLLEAVHDAQKVLGPLGEEPTSPKD